MSVYLEKGRGWKYDFVMNGERHQSGYYRTKKEAKQEEAKKRDELENPLIAQEETVKAEQPETPHAETKTQTDTAFLRLVNKRLDHVKAYNSERHYKELFYLAKKWIKRWGELTCYQVTRDEVEEFIFERKMVSSNTANKEIRYLRATFNFGIKKKLIADNPLDGIEFFPVDKKIKYVPPPEDIDKVIEVADQDTQDYLWTVRDTIGRMSEINRLTWDDVDFNNRTVTLYTRKKKDGSLTPRKVPMTKRLFEILSRRYEERDPDKPWVFWHTYTSSKTKEKKEGPYRERKRIMRTLCKKADVRYFRFHAMRHSGASVMDNSNVPIGAIQSILGHEHRTTTEIYLHSVGNPERHAIDVFESASTIPSQSPSQSPSQTQ